MEVEIQTTKADYITFFNKTYFQRLKKTSTLLLCGFLFICLYNGTRALSQRYNLSRVIVIDIIIIIGILGCRYFLPRLIFLIRLNKAIEASPKIFNKIKLTLVENGISTGPDSNVLEWRKIISVSKVNNYIFFRTVGNKSVLIPTRFFKSGQDIEIFYSTIRKKINRTKA